MHSVRFMVDASDHEVSNMFIFVEICMSQNLMFVSNTIVICTSIVIDWLERARYELLPFGSFTNLISRMNIYESF
jgi:hypothetical protein